MEYHFVTINEKGTPHPRDVNASRGDIITFKATGCDIVLCVPAEVFGAERFEIPKLGIRFLVVQPDAPKTPFEYVCCNYPDYKCGDPPEEGKGDSGGVRVGPPF